MQLKGIVVSVLMAICARPALVHAMTDRLEERVVLAQLAPEQDENSAGTAPSTDQATGEKPTEEPREQRPERQSSWLDSGHGFVTERADDLTQWFDAYFGGGDQEDTGAYSRLRLRLIEDWDQRLGNDVRVRIGGKVNLPEISKRLDLVFQGDDPLNEINGGDDPSQSRVALELKVNPL